MNDMATAIKDSNERKARLNKALETRQSADNSIRAASEENARQERLAHELYHAETELNKHGLSIHAVLRDFVKKFHGIDMPVAPPIEIEE